MPAKLNDLRPLMSEQGYMHRRVQVEIAWFIALSDVGFAEFKPLSPGARSYLTALVKNFSEADAVAIKAFEKVTNHDVKAVEYWIKSKFKDRPELEHVGEFVHFACTSEDINNTSHALQLKGARAKVILPALDGVIAKLREDGPRLRRCAHAEPHPRPDRQPHDGGQRNGQRGDAPERMPRKNCRRQTHGQDERRRGQLQRPFVRLA